MAIKTLRIDNYRSIEHIEVTLGQLNAFVGRNNAGKSNILQALAIILGETWPSRPFTEKDFHKHDNTMPINVAVVFDAPLDCDLEVYGFRLTYKADDDVEYVAIDVDWNDVLYPRGNFKRVSRQMRDEVSTGSGDPTTSDLLSLGKRQVAS